MPSQQQIERFTLLCHQRAVARLRTDRSLLTRALSTLERWQVQRGRTASDPYFDRWRDLLQRGPDAVESAVCTESEEAATPRNASPLGFLVSPAERAELLRASRS